MKDSRELFDLIKSLSTSEKRVISMSIAKSTSSNNNPAYLKLFRALDKLSEYDTDRLKKILKGEDFLRYLPVLKNYLYQLILKNLKNLNSGGSLQMDLYESFAEIDLLYQKGLYTQANKKLKKLKQEADHKEAFEILLLCYQWDSKLMMVIPDPLDPKILLKKQIETSKKADELCYYKYLTTLYRRFMITKGNIHNKSEEKWVKNFLKDPFLQNGHKVLSDISGLFHYSIRVFAHAQLGNYSQCTKDLQAELDIYERKVPFDKSIFNDYTSMYCNKILYLFYDKQYKAALTTLNEFIQLVSQTKKEKWEYQINGRMLLDYQYKCLFMESAINFLSGRYEKAIDMAPKMETFLKDSRYQIPKAYLIETNYYIAYNHFILGNYKQTLQYLNKILNYTKEDLSVREDIYCLSKLLLLMTHYELKTEDILKYLLRSTYHFLAQRKRIYGLERAILLFIKNKLLKNTRVNLFTENVIEFKNKLEKIAKKPYEKSHLMDLDIIAWLESKIRRKSFLEIMKEKYKVPITYIE
jgi:hypothetical protein